MCVCETYSAAEVENMLKDAGHEPGTPEFDQAKHKQFLPAEGMPGQFVDHPSYDPEAAS